MTSSTALSVQDQYVQTLNVMSNAELEQERLRAVANNELECLNYIAIQIMSRNVNVQTQLTTLNNQFAQLQQQLQSQASSQAPTAPLAPSAPNAASNVFAQKTIKIEKPQNFDGSPGKLSNFLFTVVQYMDTTGLRDPTARCQFAVTLLRGRALTWWRTWCDRLPHLAATLDYNTFASKLEFSFRDVDHVDRLRRRLASLRQQTSVQKYIDEFRTMIIELGTAKPDDNTVLFQFINGLKPTVQLQVRLTRPNDIIQAEQAAEQADSALYLATRGGHNNFSNGKGKHQREQPVPMDLGSAHQSQSRPPLKNVTCHRCGKKGHFRRDCRVKLNADTSSNWRKDTNQRVNWVDQASADVDTAFPPPPPAMQ